MLKKINQSLQQLQKSVLAATHYLYFITIWNYGTDSTEHCRSPMEYETPLMKLPKHFSFQTIQHQMDYQYSENKKWSLISYLLLDMKIGFALQK